MSKTKTSGRGDIALVSEVNVEDIVTSVEIASTLTKIGLGTYQTVTEAFRGKAKDCFIVGKVVAVKKTCSLNGIQKLIMREVSPEGVSGNIFALFIMGKVAEHLNQFTVNIDDMLTIHQAHISKSCLKNLLSLQLHPYELQVICGHSEREKIPSTGVFLHIIRLKVPEVVEMVPDVIGKFPSESDKTSDEMTPEDTPKAPEETEKAPVETEKTPDKMTPEDFAKAPEETAMTPGETEKTSDKMTSEDSAKAPEGTKMGPDDTDKIPEDMRKDHEETEKTPEDPVKAPEETEMGPDVTGKVPNVIEAVLRQHDKNSTQEENTLSGNGECAEVANGSGLVTPKKIRRGRRKLLDCEDYNYLNVFPKKLKKQSKCFYTKIREITASCTKANIIGVITSVEKVCRCMEEKEHLEIHLQDEGSSGKNFILNVGCSVSELPPLHVNYILRAMDVLVLFVNDVATGWVTKGNLLATVDSDCEKPISLLSVEENCTLSEEDGERIYELRNFVKASFPLGDLSIQSGVSCCTLASENLSQDVTTTTAPVIDEDEMQEGLQKQKVVLEQLLTFLNQLPIELESLRNECVRESTAYKCLECGSVSLIPAGALTRRSSPRLSSRSHLCRKVSNSAKRIYSEVERLRQTVKSALAATIPETNPL